MRKLLFALTVILAVSVSMNTINGTTVGSPLDEIALIDAGTDEPHPVSLPLFPVVQAFLGEVIIVQFNEGPGDAVIVVYDAAGAEIDRTYYNSDAPGRVTLPVPDPGAYKIYIAGQGFAVEGSFTAR